MFGSDYPRGVVNCLWLCFPAFDALPIASALPVPFLLARSRLPISLLRLPSRPSTCRLAACSAAIPLARLPRAKGLIASFQQTTPRTRPARRALPPTLISGSRCRTLGKAHGRSRLPEALARERNPLLSRAQQASESPQNQHSNGNVVPALKIPAARCGASKDVNCRTGHRQDGVAALRNGPKTR
jgi:hypothetical protein